MFAVFGDIYFDLPTYFDGLNTACNAEFAEHKVIEAKPRLQYTGDQLNEINIEIALHAFFCIPQDNLEQLRDALADHKARDFSFGNGEYLGSYVLTSLQETAQQTDAEGRLIEVRAHLTLKEYVGDDAQPQGQAISASGTLPGAVNDDVGDVLDEEGLSADEVQDAEDMCFDLDITPIDWPGALNALTKIGELAAMGPSVLLSTLGSLVGSAVGAGLSGIPGLASLGSAAILAVNYAGDAVTGVANLSGFLTSLPGSDLIGSWASQLDLPALTDPLEALAQTQGGDLIGAAGTLLRKVTGNNANLVSSWLPSQAVNFGAVITSALPVYNDLSSRISDFANIQAAVDPALFASATSFGWVRDLCRFPA